MAFFEQLYHKLFKSGGNDSSRILHEVIARSQKYLDGYGRWKSSEGQSKIIADFSRSYHFKKSGIENDPNVHVFSSPSSNGFALSYSPAYSKQEFQYLFDHLAEKSKELGYRMVNSDVKITEKNGSIETREKHYLKPPTFGSEGLTKQFYGNILIEHVLINDQPSYIKLLANIYSDRQYEEPESHRELITHLFATN